MIVYFRCNLCFHTLQTWKSYRRHVKEFHFRTNKAQCEYCDFEGSTIASIRSHVQVMHFNKRKYPCPKCEDVSFKERRRIVKHLQTVHQSTDEEINDIIATLAPSTDQRDKNLCPHCNTVFPTRNRLLRHVEVEHQISLETYKCKLCLVIYLTLEKQEAHTCPVKTKIELELQKYAKHGEAIECPECEDTNFLANLAEFEKHYYDEHALNCEIAREYRIGKRQKLDSTYDGTYVSREPILCHLCPFFANSRGVMQAHVRAEHTQIAMKRKRDLVPLDDLDRKRLNLDDPDSKMLIPDIQRVQSVISNPIVYPADSDRSADFMKSYCIYCTYGPCSYKRIKWHIGHNHPHEKRYFCPVCRIGLEYVLLIFL